MSLAKIGELAHRPFKPLRATATCAGLKTKALTESVAIFFWISLNSRARSFFSPVAAYLAARSRNSLLS